MSKAMLYRQQQGGEGTKSFCSNLSAPEIIRQLMLDDVGSGDVTLTLHYFYTKRAKMYCRSSPPVA